MSGAVAYASFHMEAVRWALDGWGAIADGGRRLVELDGEGCEDGEVIQVWRPGERHGDSPQFLIAAEPSGGVTLTEVVRVRCLDLLADDYIDRGTFQGLRAALDHITPLSETQATAADALATLA